MMFYRDTNLHDNNHQYYHNVLVTCIALSPYWWDQFYLGLDEIWDVQELTSARPRVIWAYRDDNINEEEYDWELSYVSHAVVAIGKDNSIAFFDTETYYEQEVNPWEI